MFENGAVIVMVNIANIRKPILRDLNQALFVFIVAVVFQLTLITESSITSRGKFRIAGMTHRAFVNIATLLVFAWPTVQNRFVEQRQAGLALQKSVVRDERSERQCARVL